MSFRIQRNWLALPLALLALISVSAPAHAGVGMTTSLLGGLNQTTTSGGATGYTAGGRLGFGLGVVDLEVSGMFLSRAFTGIDSIHYIEIPAVLRFPILPAFSVGAGFYYDAPLTSGAGKVYGLRGGLQLQLPAIPIFVEGNFDYNLGNGDAGSVNDFQALVGFRF